MSDCMIPRPWMEGATRQDSLKKCAATSLKCMVLLARQSRIGVLFVYDNSGLIACQTVI